MKSTKPNYAVIYSYQEEGVGGPGGCNPSWTEWKVEPFETFSELDEYLQKHPELMKRDNFTKMGAL